MRMRGHALLNTTEYEPFQCRCGWLGDWGRTETYPQGWSYHEARDAYRHHLIRQGILARHRDARKPSGSLRSQHNAKGEGMRLHDGVRRGWEAVLRTFTPKDPSSDAGEDADEALEVERWMTQGREDSPEETEKWLEKMRTKHGEGE